MRSITLQTSDNQIVSGDVIGLVNFAASAESDGGAAILIAGSIYSQGEGSFQSSYNPASLVFATSANDSLAASGKIKINHDGNILPMQDGFYSLGDPNLNFKHLYVDGITVSGEYTFPASDGSADQVIKTDGAGNLSFATVSTGGGGLSDIVEDTTPQLGGNLDTQNYSLTYTSSLEFSNASNTSLSLAPTIVSVNAGGANVDFQVKGDTDLYLLYTDASTDRVGIGKNNPSYLLDVDGTANATTLSIGGTAITATAAELNYVDGVTSNIQTQLNAKAPTASPTFTGTPAAPTAAAGTNTTQVATTAYVTTAISNLVDGAPTALDTLNELAAALNDDASAATTLTNLINTTSGNLRTDIDLKLENIVEDTTPQLGGTLDANGNTIDMGTNTITDTKVGQWDTAYGWGDHSTQGYLTTDSDTTYTAGSGLTLVGTEFNIYGGSGYLTELQFPTPNVNVANASGQYLGINITGTGLPTYLGIQNNSDISIGYGNYHDSTALGTRSTGGNILLGSNIGSGTTDVTSFHSNTLIGGGLAQALKGGSTFSSNVGIGNTTLQYSSGVTSSIALGSALRYANTISNSVAIGNNAGSNSSNISDSVMIGPSVGGATKKALRSVYIGNNVGGDYEQESITIGYNVGINSSGNNNIMFGGHAVAYNLKGNNNIEIWTRNSSVETIIGTNNNKINIEKTIIGDTSSKLLAIGNVGSSDLTPDATLEVKPNATTDVGLIVQAAASHSASLQEWQNSSETKLLAVGPDGGLEIPSNTPSTTTNKLYNDGSNLNFGTKVIIDSTNVNTGLQYQPLAGGLNVTGLTTTEFSAATLVTESDAISSNDNDTTIPTSAAVKDYVDGQGFLTSETSHADVVVDGDFGSQGIMLRGASAGTYSILTDNSSNWNTAYGWGDHSSAGYLTAHPTISAASSSDNSGRTYIQDIILDSNGHVTGLTTATETGGSPGGSDTQIQFNDGGSFGGDADLVWNKTTNALTITGSLNATTKSFLIDHPSKPGMKLQYASLEGPENGVYVRGTTDEGFITLPDYWRDLVHNGSITVTLTPVGQFQPLFVEQKSNREIRVGGVCGYYDYVVYGERKDVDKLEVEW